MLPISRNSGLRSNPNWANLLEKGFAIPCVVTATAASARVEYILCEILVSSKQNELCLYQMVNFAMQILSFCWIEPAQSLSR